MSIWKVRTVLPSNSDVQAWVLITLSTINRNLKQLMVSPSWCCWWNCYFFTLSMFLRVRPIFILKAFKIFYSIFYDFNTNRAIQISSMIHSIVFMNIHLISFIIKYVLTFITLNLMKMISRYNCSIFKKLII